jgi:type VI secretion system protein ImpM
MSAPAAALAGVYGKVPSKADFVHRNLPSAFVRPWDDWLSRCLHDGRQRMGGAWTEVYLSGPVWRFAAEPGLLGPAGWCGVLATSVDAVNRLYPLTIALPVGEAPDVVALHDRLEPWLPRLEDIALDMIEGVLDVEAALGQVLDVSRAVGRGDEAPGRYVWRDDSRGDARGWLALAGTPAPPMPRHRPAADSSPFTGWWRAPWNGEPAASLACRGLPPADVFASLLDGCWFERGWTVLEPGEVAP